MLIEESNISPVLHLRVDVSGADDGIILEERNSGAGEEIEEEGDEKKAGDDIILVLQPRSRQRMDREMYGDGTDAYKADECVWIERGIDQEREGR